VKILVPVYWLRSAVAYVIVCVYVAIVGPPALVWAAVTGASRPIFALGRFGARLFRVLLGVRLEVEGLEHVVGDRPSVYCINHRSNVDVVVFEVLLPRCPRLRGLYKAELGKVPVLGRALRVVGFVPVEREHRAKAIAAVDEAVARLREGGSFLVAPEGTRATGDDLLPLKKGGFVMAIKAQVPVVPVALIGTADAMPRGRAWAKPTVVRVVVGEPIPTAGLTFHDRDALSAAFRERLERLLER
jgi:1-acyl-sn-glycerol-3-phosphate acyltransferase